MSVPRKNVRGLLDPKKALAHILKQAVRITGASGGSVLLLNPNTGSLDVEASCGSSKAKNLKLRLGQGLTGWVAMTGRMQRVNNVARERRYLAVNRKVKSEMAVPLDHAGQVIGILNVESLKINAFTEAHEKALVAWAAESSEWLQVVWEVNHLRTKVRQLEVLADMGQVIVSQNIPDQVLKRIVMAARGLMDARLSSLMLVSDDGEELILKAWDGASVAYVKKPNLHVTDSLVGVVVRRLKPLAVLNVQENQRYQHTELARREGLVSLLSVPLVFEGRAVGVLSVYTGQMHRFSNEEIRMLSALAGLSAVAIAKARLLEKVVKVEENLRASERLSALGWLAAEVAHEIRNPLTVMQMVFHSMVQGLPLGEEGRRDAELIEMKMKQLNRIVEQVLTFAQSSEPSMELLDVEAMMGDLMLLIRHKLAEQEIELKRSVAEGLPPVLGDRTQIEQAVLNLILNACQAMPGGGTLTLTAGLEKPKGGVAPRVRLVVKDTGEGMSRRRQDELFQPFLTHRKGGTGLGLALVRKTIELHRGEITVSSRPGRGTAFTIYLPVAE
jgi:signal transduction histidine kinase